MQDIQALGDLEKEYLALLDDFDHRREDLWYLRSIVQQFFITTASMVEKMDNSTPPMYFHLFPWYRQSSPSRPSVFRIYVGNNRDRPKEEVMRFSIKFYHKDNLVPRGPNHPKAWRPVPDVRQEALSELLPIGSSEGTPHLYTADVILWEAFEDSFLHLMGPETVELNPHRSLRTDHIGEWNFEAFGSRREGNYVCMRARRNVSEDYRLIVTGFYNTKAVEHYFKVREERSHRVESST